MATESYAPTDRHGRWTVEFHELRDINRYPAVRCLTRDSLSAVIKLWLKIITPGATVIEQDNDVGWMISFVTRSHARHFIGCFGGKLMSRSSP
jgi:hypothetical protein